MKRFEWNAAEEQGFDMSLIEQNLKLTLDERMEQHDRALNQALLLRKAATNSINGLSGAIAAASRTVDFAHQASREGDSF